MKPLLNYITNDITKRNNADLEMKSVYLCVYSRFFLICLLFMNIHEYAKEIIACMTTGCKDFCFVLKISLLFMNMQII